MYSKICNCGNEMTVQPYLGGLQSVKGCYLNYKGQLRFKVGRPKKLIQSVTCNNCGCLRVSMLKTFTPL